MILRPPAVYDPYAVGNNSWASSLLWIPAVIALIFGLFLFVSYMNNRKKHLMVWALSFFGIWVFYHQLIASGSFEMLIFYSDTSLFGIFPTSALTLLIPGLFAAGLLFDKDDKLGMYYSWYLLFMSVVYILFQYDVFPGIENAATFATIVTILVQLPSIALMIYLPVMKEGNLPPRALVASAGILMLIINILLWIMAFVAPAADASVDLVTLLFPFFLSIYVLLLTYGIAGNKDWGFDLPHVDFGDAKESTGPKIGN